MLKQCISFRIELNPESFDLVLAILSEMGADAFQEHDDALEAFLEGENLDHKQATIETYLNEHKYNFQRIVHQRTDWNAEWESNFKPYTIEAKLIVRAPFHPSDPDFAEELIIFPKMAFGTGHHETTAMILSILVDQDFTGKQILDFGCGTGILGILAAKHHADHVVFIDNDSLCTENTEENLRLNSIKECQVSLGSSEVIPKMDFDLIIANITRNILVESLPVLSSHLKQNGQIILSGFLQEDLEEMSSQLKLVGLKYNNHIQNGDWICIIGEKSRPLQTI